MWRRVIIRFWTNRLNSLIRATSNLPGASQWQALRRSAIPPQGSPQLRRGSRPKAPRSPREADPSAPAGTSSTARRHLSPRSGRLRARRRPIHLAPVVGRLVAVVNTECDGWFGSGVAARGCHRRRVHVQNPGAPERIDGRRIAALGSCLTTYIARGCSSFLSIPPSPVPGYRRDDGLSDRGGRCQCCASPPPPWFRIPRRRMGILQRDAGVAGRGRLGKPALPRIASALPTRAPAAFIYRDWRNVRS